ncbi:uncharacterized protein LOC118781557 [Megalops cyprinoides]|uniref:uncharacterized protein LOC118781557 n=1 Tax=Megalops cyprinoides TaxID=118141 RepID=UPI0018641F5E|nr:uncharacterized protein LOC118781557 [Megalops cyprinoides]XP_036390405.1 uncharacterized protein LOC118781557 [Megalops cyprinoides]
MSASDSDCSTDWLASDDEDCDSASELDCVCPGARKTPPLPAPSGEESSNGQLHLDPMEGSRNSDVMDKDSCLSGDSGVPSRGIHSGCTQSQASGMRNLLLSGKHEQSGSLCRSPPHAAESLQREGPRQAQKRPCGSEALGVWASWQNPNKTDSGELFARKCMELQCYVPHLSSILNGLQAGRYRERLSSFQESVAMDRIQRIMGVLQNPCMGERYINIILKVEEMLRSWFPNVKSKDQLACDQTEETTPSKRKKLCPVTTAESPMSLGGPPGSSKALGVSEPTPLGAYSATNLKWLHTSPICSPTAELALGGLRQWPPPAPPRDKGVMQDSAVSSSTDSPPESRPPLGKINAPCLERLLKSTESIISRKNTGPTKESSWS